MLSSLGITCSHYITWPEGSNTINILCIFACTALSRTVYPTLMGEWLHLLSVIRL